MKKLILILTLLMVVATFSVQAKKELKTVVFTVDVDCPNCTRNIEKNIAFEKGVKDLELNMEKKEVSVTYVIGKTDNERLIKAFKKIGKTAKVKAPEKEEKK